MKKPKSAKAAKKPILFTYKEHQEWHRAHHQSLAELAGDFHRVNLRPPSSFLELWGWSSIQCERPENPPPPEQAKAQPASQVN